MIVAFLLLLILLVSAGTFFNLTKDTGAFISPQQDPDISPVQLTAEERQWVDTHPDITFCPDPDYPPFEFYDESGAYAGISADYLRLIVKKTGLHLYHIRENDFSTCVEKIKAKNVDMLSTVFTSDLRKGYLNYSDSFYQPPMVIITKKSVGPTLTLEDLNGMSVAVVEGYTTHELLKQKYPGIRIQPVPNIRTGLQKVSLGIADAFFNDLATSTYYVEKEGLTNLHIAGEYRPEDPQQFRLAFGIRTDEPELQDILNKGLSMITPAERNQITKKWISSTLTPSLFDSRTVIALFAGLGILALFSAIILVWNRSLRIAVSEKTKDLSQELEERRKAEKALRESEEKYRTILTNIQDVYYRSDREGHLTMASPSWATLLGYDSLDECLGHDIAEKFYTNPLQRKDFIDAVSRTGSVSDYEVVLKKKDGNPLYVSTNSHLYYDENGAALGIEGIFRDISERKRAEENLLRKTMELRAAYEQLAATEGELRHNYEELSRIQQALTQARKKLNLLNTVTFQDLQNAVFSLMGYLELERNLKTDAKSQGYIEQEQGAAQRISGILEFAKAYQDLGISPPRWHNVNQTFLYAISHMDLSKNVRKENLEGLEIYADPLLEKVFFNLAENVLVHGTSATEISLTCKETSEGLTLFFTDNGTGIADSEKQKIFLKGYGSQKGMGLFLAREILEITGITLQETGEYGKGARFEITVPEGAYRFGDKPGH